MGKTFKRVYDYPKPTKDRRQLLEELSLITEQIEWEDTVDSIYFIVQQYQPNDSEYDLIDYMGEYYGTYDEAHQALQTLASRWDVEIEDENSFHLTTPAAGLAYDMYYIEELHRA